MNNLTKKETAAIKSLRENKEICIRQADKGGGLVVQNLADYVEEAIRLLLDESTYLMISSDPLTRYELEFKTLLIKAFDDGILTKQEFKYITIEHPVTPFFLSYTKDTQEPN